MHNGNKYVHINSSGRNILSHNACSSVSKCTIDDMISGVVGQLSRKSGLRQTCSLLTGEITEAMPTMACYGLTGED